MTKHIRILLVALLCVASSAFGQSTALTDKNTVDKTTGVLGVAAGTFCLKGSSSGCLPLNAPAAAGSTALILQDFKASGTGHIRGLVPDPGGSTGSTKFLREDATFAIPGGGDVSTITGFGTGVATFLGTPSSANLASAITNETGSGLLVFGTSPTLTTPTIGVATATSVNKVAITAPATSATLAIADGKTFTVNQTITLTGTSGTTMTFPSTSATIARTDAAQTFSNTVTATDFIVGSISNVPIQCTTGAISSALTPGTGVTATCTATGAATGMAVSVSPTTFPGYGYIPYAYVSASDTVTVVLCSNKTGTPTSSTYNAVVFKK